MKKICIFLLLVLFAFAIPSQVKADDTPRVFLDGQELTFDVPPVIVDGRLMVPLGKIAEYLHIWYQWHSDTMTISLGYSCCTIGSSVAWANGERVDLDTPPIIINGRIFVPLRFMAQATHCSVNYDVTTRTITISSTGSNENIKLDNNTWLYYRDNAEDNLWRQRPDGSEKQEVLPGFGAVYNINGEIYVRSSEQKSNKYLWTLYKISETGELLPIMFGEQYPGGFWKDMYNYYYVSEEGNLIKQDISSGKTLIILSKGDFWPWNFEVHNDFLYFEKDSSLYRVKTDGSLLIETIIDPLYSPIQFTEEAIFYVDHGNLVKVNMDGTDKTDILSDNMVRKFIIRNEWIYCECEDGIAKMMLDGSHFEQISNDHTGTSQGIIGVKNGWVFYNNVNSNGSIYAIKDDGTYKYKITNHDVFTSFVQ